jgi:hypothetical protein
MPQELGTGFGMFEAFFDIVNLFAVSQALRDVHNHRQSLMSSIAFADKFHTANCALKFHEMLIASAVRHIVP